MDHAFGPEHKINILLPCRLLCQKDANGDLAVHGNIVLDGGVTLQKRDGDRLSRSFFSPHTGKTEKQVGNKESHGKTQRKNGGLIATGAIGEKAFGQ